MARYSANSFIKILAALSISVLIKCRLSAGESLADSTCIVPIHFQGDYFSMEQGNELNTIVTPDRLTHETFDGACRQFTVFNETIDHTGGNFDSQVLFHDEQSDCYMCWEMRFRTPNIVQYKISSCHSSHSRLTMGDVCRDIQEGTAAFTFFRKSLETVNCKNTFEGVYHFTYEINYGGGGICSSPNSKIVACQEPGSPYVDNQVFNMRFAKCPDVTTSVNDKIRFQCMGTWRDNEGNVWSAMTNLGKDVFRERFRCMRTRYDQQIENNEMRFTMSRWAQCDTLNTAWLGDIRLVLVPVVYSNQVVRPQCNLPRNFTGTWFNTGEFDSEVYINDTHIYFKTKIDQYTYKETYFTCQQTVDTRFMMTAVTIGKCEVDYVCFDFLPRHHNIIRWRMGRPSRLTPEESSHTDFLIRKFRQACSWSSFTIDRTQTDWKYQTFILNPPAPVDCPIAGRYMFTQQGVQSEKYFTRVEGITMRPRHQIGCRDFTSEFKSCATNTKKIFVDVEYCDTVDHTGRPIGEYDIPDNELSCVGFWMEDMRSYMITYDEEDAVSKFRCWVYERIDWRDLLASRATRATCGKNQHSRSYLPEEGASLALVLRESERLWDDCPQRFNPGADPYATELKIYVLQGGSSCMAGSAVLLLVAIISVLITHH